MDFRIGHGYDVHKLVEGRKLIIGGICIPHNFGLLGHSDADVLLHAITDALLGAAALGDIGMHFPDSDKKYKDIDSMILLSEAKKLLDKKNFRISNIDATIIAQAPKLRPYIPEMTRLITDTLELSEGRVNIKATTEEGLGFSGRCEGIAAHAVALIFNKE